MSLPSYKIVCTGCSFNDIFSYGTNFQYRGPKEQAPVVGVGYCEACEVNYTFSEENYSWRFEKCLHFNLHLHKADLTSPNGIELYDNQALSLESFSLAINPVPSEGVQNDLAWSVVVNDSVSELIPFTETSYSFIDGASMKLPGKALVHLLENALRRHASGGAASVELSLCTGDDVFSTVRFWILPGLDLVIPECLIDGDDFCVTIQMSGGFSQDAVLTDEKGSSVIRQRISCGHDGWQIEDHMYYATIELEQLNTQLRVAANPPLSGFCLGNRETGRIEPLRDLFRRELNPLDLLLPAIKHKNLEAYLDLNPITPPLKHSDKLSFFSLAEIPDLHNRENNLKFVIGDYSAEFQIRYRAALLAADFHECLIEGSVHGLISFRGPVGACLEFFVYEDSLSGRSMEIGHSILSCDGQQHEKHPLEIKLDKTVGEENACRVVLVLHEDCEGDTSSSHEYGESWQVSPEEHSEEQGWEFLFLQAKQAYSDRQYFMAKRCLRKAFDYGLKECPETMLLLRDIEAKIMSSKLRDVVVQTSRVVSKEFLLDLSK